MLLREGLEIRFSRSTRPRIDKLQPQASEAKSNSINNFEKQWEIIAEVANEILDCSQWGPPPWSAKQWSVLSICIGEGIRELQVETEEVSPLSFRVQIFCCMVSASIGLYMTLKDSEYLPEP